MLRYQERRVRIGRFIPGKATVCLLPARTFVSKGTATVDGNGMGCPHL
jgi:hypothetical protein